MSRVKTICEYLFQMPLKGSGRCTVEMPTGATILSIAPAFGPLGPGIGTASVCIYALRESDDPQGDDRAPDVVQRHFILLSTGAELPSGALKFIATIRSVWGAMSAVETVHVFELDSPEATDTWD